MYRIYIDELDGDVDTLVDLDTDPDVDLTNYDDIDLEILEAERELDREYRLLGLIQRYGSE